MPYDAASRIMSISFERDAKEHVDAMLDAGRRFSMPKNSSAASFYLAAIATGVAIGLITELYRRFLLPLFLATNDIPPLGVVLLQFLPLIILILALVYGLTLWTTIRRRRALMARLEPQLFVDMDIFRSGIVASSGPDVISIGWSSVRDVLVNKQRIEFESEAFVLYVPERAFANRRAFDAAFKELRTLWREARRAERDTVLVALEKK